jgi:hypothetical protein
MSEDELVAHLREAHRAKVDETSSPGNLHRRLHRWASCPKDRHDHDETPAPIIPGQGYGW